MNTRILAPLGDPTISVRTRSPMGTATDPVPEEAPPARSPVGVREPRDQEPGAEQRDGVLQEALHRAGAMPTDADEHEDHQRRGVGEHVPDRSRLPASVSARHGLSEQRVGEVAKGRETDVVVPFRDHLDADVIRARVEVLGGRGRRSRTRRPTRSRHR